MFDPRYPDTYVKAFDQMKAQAADLHEMLMAEAETVKVDAFAFFDEVRAQQIDLTESQRTLHEKVLTIEDKWTKAETVEASHKQYREAIQFFSRNETNINTMAQKMEELTSRVAAAPG